MKEIKDCIKKEQIRVAKINGETIGFIQFSFSKQSPYGLDYGKWKREFCWIENMAVNKKFRKKGIGKKLIQDIEKLCKKRGIKEILLDVFEINKNAREFYAKLGFKNIIHIDSKKVY